MKNGSILIISNNPDVSKKISEKIKLLRECDTVQSVSFLEAISVLNSSHPSLIILYWAKEDSVNIVKEIRSIHSLDKVPIIFVMDSLIEEILFCAFDYGIDEFFYLNDPDSIILMRIFLSLQKAILYKKIDTNEEIMMDTNILDKKTNIYSSEYSHVVLNYFVNKCLEDNIEDTILMYVKPLPLDKKFLNQTKIASYIKSVPRSSDIIAFAEKENTGFYLILNNCTKVGAKSVTQRLKKTLEGSCEIYANALEITLPFEKIQSLLVKSINEQIMAKNDFNFFFEDDIRDYYKVLEEEEENKKFKQEDFKDFFRNFEKIIIPVFYHFQTVYSSKFPNTEIKFDVSEEQSYFTIINNNVKSKLIITFPMFSKVIIDISHTSENSSPSTQRKVFEIKEFNEEMLSDKLKDFINEFMQFSGLNELSKAE